MAHYATSKMIITRIMLQQGKDVYYGKQETTWHSYYAYNQGKRVEICFLKNKRENTEITLLVFKR